MASTIICPRPSLPTRENPREALGRLLDELEAQGLRDDTLIVFTSDHGLNCGQHGLWGKGNATLPLNMLEESIRAPLVFHQPRDLFAGQRRVECVDHLDVFQTIADYADITGRLDDSRRYPGRSFLPLLDNSGALADWRTTRFGEYGDMRMARGRRFKLLRFRRGEGDLLFDLRRDPGETVNLHGDGEYAAVAERLSDEMDAYFGRYEDADKSGLRVRELPRHNLTEAWRV